MLDILWSPLPMLIIGIVLGVIFDEFFTTKFAWAKKRTRRAYEEFKDKI